MLTLDFSFSNEWNQKIDQTLISEMSDVDLRFEVALGDLILVINGVDCTAAWGWIPLLDLAIALCDIRDHLNRDENATQTFDFTENDAEIAFERIGDLVRISTNYASSSEIITLADLDSHISIFRDKVFQEAQNLFPALQESDAFRTLRDDVSPPV